MKAPVLTTANLSAGYGGRGVLDDIAFNVAEGERVALIGPNGCGKSTLLRAITAEIVESGGSIVHRGTEISQMETDEIVRRGVGYLRQTRNFFPGLTVAENLRLAGLNNGSNGFAEVFPALTGRERVRAGLLSGGERQSLAVAMTLTRPTSILLLDEPIAGMTQANAQSVLGGIAHLQRQHGFATVVVEHRLRLIESYVDRVVVMVRGRIEEDTRDTSILTDRGRLERHYLL